MRKFPWIQKVEIHICEECHNHMFYGENFLNTEKERNFLANYPDTEDPNNLWTFDITFNEPTNHTNIPATVKLFQCDLCKTLEEQKQFVYSVSRIINPDKFEDFVNSARACANYICSQESEWEELEDMIKEGDELPVSSILYNTSLVLGHLDYFHNLVDTINFQVRNK